MAKQLLSDRTVAQLKGIMLSAMDYTCIIERPVEGATDEYGHEGEAAWAIHLPDVKCLFSQQTSITSNTGEQVNNNALYLLSRYSLSVPVDTDVLATDRITNLKNRDGALVDASVQHYEIVEVAPVRTHIMLVLKAIR